LARLVLMTPDAHAKRKKQYTYLDLTIPVLCLHTNIFHSLAFVVHHPYHWVNFCSRSKKHARSNGMQMRNQWLLEVLVTGGARDDVARLRRCFHSRVGFIAVDPGRWGSEDWIIQVVVSSLLV